MLIYTYQKSKKKKKINSKQKELINSWNYVRDPRYILNIYGHGDYNYIKKISFLISSTIFS